METRSNYIMVGAVTVALLAGVGLDEARRRARAWAHGLHVIRGRTS